jgi:hypothetical protein
MIGEQSPLQFKYVVNRSVRAVAIANKKTAAEHHWTQIRTTLRHLQPEFTRLSFAAFFR